MMFLSTIVVILAALALALLVIFGRLQEALAKRSDWAETEFVALSLSRLMDPAEQQYLRARIPSRSFRKVQRKRMKLAWRYAKRLRLDTAAIARMDLSAARSVVVELNELNVVLLRVQLKALAGYLWPDQRLAKDRFSEQWHRFAEQLPEPKLSAESSRGTIT